ncbi:MAG: nicotinate-nucleotide adenylyltransferase, partial [Candidatus Omnitrophota bacterium]|nr:nicotinate-nucleotide adenylyltransferase [Candidatus Omnitrophota bacterium]
MKTTRIGLLGGTFNPVHIGHMVIAQTALDKAGLDRVIFVPCHEPPHKKIPHLASARDRLAMIRLAVAENPRFDVSDVEVRRAGRSYTIDTVRHFRDLYKGKAKLHFIIGGDSFAALSAWHCIDEIARIVTFIVV